MRVQYLVHDHAMSLGAAVLGIVGPFLSDDQRREAHARIVEAALAMLSSYEEKIDRAHRRVKPGSD